MEFYEFESIVIPEVRRCWPSYKRIGDEAMSLFDAFKAATADALRQAIRRHKTEDLPRWPDFKRVRELLRESGRHYDPSAWTWSDEHRLWQIILAKWPNVFMAEIPLCWGDEGWVARHVIGKNPSSEERTAAMEQIQRVIEDARQRMKAREGDRNFMTPWAIRDMWDDRVAGVNGYAQV